MAQKITVWTTVVNLADSLWTDVVEDIRNRNQSRRTSFVLRNWTSGATVYVGTAGIEATTDSMPVEYKESISFDENSLHDITLISDTVDTDIRRGSADSYS